MKRFISLLFVLFCLVLSAPHHVIAVTKAATPPRTSVTPKISPTPTPVPATIEYELPYPGILPTHPLYFLKNLRDQIIESLITDPVSKAEFYLLQADKKVNMGIILKASGKKKEAKVAFNEAFEAHNKSIAILMSEQKSGKDVPRHILEKLSLSLLKHKEVLTGAGENTDAITAQIAKARTMMPAE